MKQVYNPFLPLNTYIPDGEPHVFGDKVYLFGSHDKESGESYCMLDYEVWSAPLDDLTNWTCPGPSYHASQDPNFSPDRSFMYAPDVVRGNDGRYYLYYCLAGWKGIGGYAGPISVAVATKPDGPYSYYGHVQYPDGSEFDEPVLFDPALINDDGTIRLYYGANAPKGLDITKWNKWWASSILAKIFSRDKSDFTEEGTILGARQVVLEDDMLTVQGPVQKLTIEMSKKDKKAGHDFFEGASIRKIDQTYYFIFSSQNNHELCYATSAFPDKDFVYQGILVSTGDVGFEGRLAKDRVQATGTTHGSIEKIGDAWYVFYHRLTHGSDYSRQACAEKLLLDDTGRFSQVPVTSCGLNGKPLSAIGTYPAGIACYLRQGKMPHISNKIIPDIPQIVSYENGQMITNIVPKTTIGFKYFEFEQSKYQIILRTRGQGKGYFTISLDEFGKEIVGSVRIEESAEWTNFNGEIATKTGSQALFFHFEGEGALELLSFQIERL